MRPGEVDGTGTTDGHDEVLDTELEHLALVAELAGVELAEVVVPTHRQVVVGGMRLHALDWEGHADAPILFLHGGGLNAHTWDLVCLALRGRHRCYALDLRGHGDSEWSPGSDYSLDHHLADLEGVIDALGLDRFALVGQSWGAIIAIRYAARHPERLSALAAVDAGPFARHQPGMDRIVAFSLGRDSFETLEEAVEHAVAFNPRRDRRLLRHSLGHALRPASEGGWTWKRDLRHASGGRVQDRVEALVAEVRSTASDATAIGCPTLVVHGVDSDVFSADEASHFAALVPDGRWVSVENAGHNVQGDNPAGLLHVLAPFLAAHDDGLIQYLDHLGAGEIDHPGGNLFDHLKRTAARLAEWHARPDLVSAGLYHAVYGTDGFPAGLRSLAQRHQIAARIGDAAEGIVYRYASCDREVLLPQLGVEERPRFRDRFTGQTDLLDQEALADFLELTFANELDLIEASPAFAAGNASQILCDFRRCIDLVSPAAKTAFIKIAEVQETNTN